MNEEKDIINEYFSKLPKAVQNLVVSNDWQKRIGEMTAKYSLNATQSSTLQYEILFVVIGIERDADLVVNLQKELGVSGLLAEQLGMTIEKNLFSMIDKLFETPNKPKENPVQENRKVIGMEKKSKLVEWTESYLAKNYTQPKIQSEKQEIAKRTRLAIKTKTQGEAPEYVRSLPQAVKNVVFDGVWQDRVMEIAKKYSLSDIQINILANNVLFVLIGLDTPEAFLGLITAELGISKLLSSQIIEDLGSRVFDYALKFKGVEPVKTPVVDNKPIDTEKPKIPEIMPKNLPMVEKGEAVHINQPENKLKIPTPQYKPTYKPNVEAEKVPEPVMQVSKPVQKEEVKEISHINYTKPTPAPEPAKPEPVQKPVSVPRFVGMKEDADKVFTPQNMIDAKLANVTTGVSQQKEKVDPDYKYAVDPYRESIE